MTIPQSIKWGTEQLKEKEFCERPFLDTVLLLSSATGISKEALLAADNTILLPQKSEGLFLEFLSRREKGESVAAILGEKEFYSRIFKIDTNVLSPRPDTEFAVEAALELIKKHQYRKILDLCTGSGCIALTVYLEYIDSVRKQGEDPVEVSASDISPFSEKFFTINNQALAENKVHFIKSDLFDSIDQRFDLIITNPPYLTSEEYLEKENEGWIEPRLALDGGEDGFDFYTKIIDSAPDHLYEGGAIVIEAASAQMEKLASMLKAKGFQNITTIPDLSGELRIITGELLLA